MTQFIATTLDLSRFTGFALVDVNFETILAERLTSLKERFDARGIPYDVETLETDPAAILQQEDAYRETLDLAAINDAARALTLAFAKGDALDQIGTTYFATSRATVDDSDPDNIVYESDDAYRRRIQLAPEAFSGGGTAGGYLYHALTASPSVKDAGVYVPETGTGHVFVAIMSTTGDGTVSDELLETVNTYMQGDAIKLATDWLTVEKATINSFDVVANLIVRSGVEPSVVIAEARARLEAEAALRHRVNMPFPRSAIMAALHAGDVIRVDVTSPAQDIDPGVSGVAYLNSITLTTTVFS